MSSPRDRFLTVYGRQPVLQALLDERLTVDKVLVATTAHGATVDQILAAARQRAVAVGRVPGRDVTRISRNGRQDQGVVADVVAPRMRTIEEWQPGGQAILLDGVTNPQNVGLVLRAATAAGIAAVVVPRAGVADLGPLVVKASAGVAFSAPILRTPTPGDGVSRLRQAGYRVYGLTAAGDRSIFDPRPFEDDSVFVLGSESTGVQVEVDEAVSIPMAGEVESLNVATAAAVVCFELLRRRLA